MDTRQWDKEKGKTKRNKEMEKEKNSRALQRSAWAEIDKITKNRGDWVVLVNALDKPPRHNREKKPIYKLHNYNVIFNKLPNKSIFNMIDR